MGSYGQLCVPVFPVGRYGVYGISVGLCGLPMDLYGFLWVSGGFPWVSMESL